MTLAILICTLPERSATLQRLLSVLNPQIEAYKDQVYYSIHDAGKAMPTGTKRNQLINQTQSDYFVFIDDDDLIFDNYVSEILKATESNPDVITFNGYITFNGLDRRNWTIKLGSGYEERNGHYYRWPNHIVPMRREIVRHIPFQDIWQQEDYRWSKEINDLKLLKTSVHIDKDMYWYDKIQPPTRVERRNKKMYG